VAGRAREPGGEEHEQGCRPSQTISERAHQNLTESEAPVRRGASNGCSDTEPTVVERASPRCAPPVEIEQRAADQALPPTA
jgi:hypothetical protein